jgi:hypothetical protein
MVQDRKAEPQTMLNGLHGHFGALAELAVFQMCPAIAVWTTA